MKNLEKEFEKFGEVQVDDVTLQRVEQNVLSQLKRRKSKRPQYIMTAIAATLFLGFLTYQIPDVKAWVKETFTYIPGFNQEVNKESGVLYSLDKKMKEGKVTFIQAAYESSVPYFAVELEIPLGVKGWKAVEEAAPEFAKKNHYLVVGKEKYPIEALVQSWGDAGIFEGRFTLKESVKSLPAITNQTFYVELDGKRYKLPLKVNTDRYQKVKSKKVNGFQLEAMVMEKDNKVYVHFLRDDVRGYGPSWNKDIMFIVDEQGHKTKLTANEAGSIVYGKYKGDTSKLEGTKRTIEVKELEQFTQVHNEKIKIPIPQNMDEELELETIVIEELGLSLEGVKVQLWSYEDGNEVGLVLPDKKDNTQDYIQALNLKTKDERKVGSMTWGSEEDSEQTFANGIQLLPTDKDYIEVDVDYVTVIRYGPWKLSYER